MNAPGKFALLVAAAVIALPQPAAAKSAPAAWAGTWQLNTAKSKFASPSSSEKSETRTYTVTGDRLSMTSTFTNHAGKVIKWSYSAKTDGKWNAASGNPNFNRIALTMAGDRQINAMTTDGKTTGHAIATVSADGKQLTVIRMGTKTKPGPDSDTLVFDRAK